MPQQANLFDDADVPAPAAPAGGVLRIDQPAASLSKAQREFNRLSARIDRLRDELSHWRAAEERAHQREAADVAPQIARLTALQKQAVLWIDGFLARPPSPGERLPKKLRTKLKHLLLHLARAALANAPDDAVEAAHDRHAGQSHREDQREQVDLAAAMLGQALGDHRLFDGAADSMDELLARAAERMRAQADAQADIPSDAPRPGRAAKAREREAKALKEASQSVREAGRRRGAAAAAVGPRVVRPRHRSAAAGGARRAARAAGRPRALAGCAHARALPQPPADRRPGRGDRPVRGDAAAADARRGDGAAVTARRGPAPAATLINSPGSAAGSASPCAPGPCACGC